MLDIFQKQLKVSLKYSSQNYSSRTVYQSNFNDPLTSFKTSWLNLKSFLNTKNLCIPSMFPESSFITDFKRKAQLFKSRSTRSCSLVFRVKRTTHCTYIKQRQRNSICSSALHKHILTKYYIIRQKAMGKLFWILNRIKLLMERIWSAFACYKFTMSVYRTLETI